MARDEYHGAELVEALFRGEDDDRERVKSFAGAILIARAMKSIGG